MIKKDYNSKYYDWRVKSALSSAEVIVPYLIESFTPSSVTDVGSAEGAWLSVFAKNGVNIIQGFDGEWVKKEELLIPIEQFTMLDLETFEAPEEEIFDLAISLEVAEHLSESSADNFIKQLTKLSSRILFSAAIPGQGGLHHLNEQPPSYWAKKFKTYGFEQFDILRPHFWHDDRIEWWYRQNIFIYKKCIGIESEMQSLKNMESFFGAHLVHPQAFLEKQIELDLENASGSNLAKALLRRLWGNSN